MEGQLASYDTKSKLRSKLTRADPSPPVDKVGQLPDKVLLLIVEHLNIWQDILFDCSANRAWDERISIKDRKTLYNLCLVSRRFCRLFQAPLYKVFAKSIPSEAVPYGYEKLRLHKFLETMSARPDLGAEVRVIFLGSWFYRRSVPAETEMSMQKWTARDLLTSKGKMLPEPTQVELLLSRTCNIVELHVDNPCGLIERSVHRSLSHLSHLEIVTIRYWSRNPKNFQATYCLLSAIFRHESVRVLKISGLDCNRQGKVRLSCYDKQGKISQALNPGTSNISTIVLKDFSGHMNNIRILLGYCKRLETLHIMYNYSSRSNYPRWPDLMTALYPQRAHLQTLAIDCHGYRQCPFRSHRWREYSPRPFGSPMLRGFTGLRRLHVHHVVLFGLNEDSIFLASDLPPNLEQLVMPGATRFVTKHLRHFIEESEKSYGLEGLPYLRCFTIGMDKHNETIFSRLRCKFSTTYRTRFIQHQVERNGLIEWQSSQPSFGRLAVRVLENTDKRLRLGEWQ